MADRPRIGVTGSARRWAPAWWCTALALRLAGAMPERISTRHHPSGQELHGLVIGGGNDIAAEHYGGTARAQARIDPERDTLEINWIKKSVENNLPILGICRGAQLINVVKGGSLHQDIRGMRKLTSNRFHLLPLKTVQLNADSKFATICGTAKLRVNSLHHQAVSELGSGIEVVGKDLDGICQAFEDSSNGLAVAVQWHPEYLFLFPTQLRIFRWLVDSARS